MDSVERKDDAASGGLLENAGPQQRLHVAVHRLHIPLHAARGLANRHRSCTGKSANQFPSFRRQKAKQKLRCRKANARPLLLALESISHASLDVLERCHLQGHGFHYCLHSPISRQKSVMSVSKSTKLYGTSLSCKCR